VSLCKKLYLTGKYHCMNPWDTISLMKYLVNFQCFHQYNVYVYKKFLRKHRSKLNWAKFTHHTCENFDKLNFKLSYLKTSDEH